MKVIEIEVLAEELSLTVTDVIQWCRSRGLAYADADGKTRLSDEQAELLRDYVEQKVIVPTGVYGYPPSIPFLHIPAA